MIFSIHKSNFFGVSSKVQGDIKDSNITIYEYKTEKKLSITSLITEKNKAKNLIVFDDFKNEIKKTKEMNLLLNKFQAKNSLIILDKSSKDKIIKSARNLPGIKVTDINHFSAFDVIKFEKVIFTETSIKELEKKYE